MSNPSELQSTGAATVRAERIVLAPFTDDGTPAGAIEMVSDYSVTPAEFWFEVPPGKVFCAATLDIYIQGAGVVTANGYGPITALAVGLGLTIRNASGTDIVPPVLTKTTGEWARIPGTTLDIVDVGPGDNYLNVNWDFKKALGVQWQIGQGYRAVAIANDDFTGLTAHRVTLSGYLLDLP